MPISYESRVKGGIAASKVVKEKHLKIYLENPNICQYCGSPILPREGEVLHKVKIRKFCNHSCNANYTNEHCRGYTLKKNRIKKEKKYGVDENVPICSLYGKGASKYALVRAKARSKMNFNKVDKKCVICGYDKHVEVHHKKSCNTYEDDTLLSVVNDLDNIVYLCPNHHFEADNNMIVFNIAGSSR